MKEAASREPQPSRKEGDLHVSNRSNGIDTFASIVSTLCPVARLPKFPQDAQSSIVGTWVRFHLIVPQLQTMLPSLEYYYIHHAGFMSIYFGTLPAIESWL